MKVQYLGGYVMPEKWRRRGRLIGLIALLMLCLGSAPKQSEIPPQAFFADYFSGVVFLQGATPLPGIELIACIRNCETFQSEGIILGDDGRFALLEVNPTDRFLRGDEIFFYLVNAHGKTQAAETAVFEGKYAIVKIRLHFDSGLPVPMAPAALPRVGDSLLIMLPRLALGVGMFLVFLGITILVLCRRRTARH